MTKPRRDGQPHKRSKYGSAPAPREVYHGCLRMLRDAVTLQSETAMLMYREAMRAPDPRSKVIPLERKKA